MSTLPVPISRLLPPVSDLRSERDSDFLDRLGESLKREGFLHPVRAMQEGDKYRVLTGWSRALAARRAGIEEVPVILVTRPLTEAELLIEQLIENDLRSETSPLDKARAYLRLMELNGISQAELARTLHVSASEVAKTLAIFQKLVPEVHALIGTGDGKLPVRAAYALTKLADPAMIVELAGKCAKGLLKVEALEEHVARLLGNGKPKKARPVKWKAGGAQAVTPGDWPADRIVAWFTEMVEKAKRGLPPSAWPSL